MTPIPAAKTPNVPPPVAGAGLAYDAADQYVVMFGGVLQTGQISSQTWIYGGGGWANITPPPRKSQPGPRWDVTMTYDAGDGYVVLFGGCVSVPAEGFCHQSLGDTWKFQNGVWVFLIPPAPPNPPPNFPPTPTARLDAAMVYDSRVGGVVMFGGMSGLQDVPPPPGNGCTQATPQIFSDTWEFSAGRWSQLGTGPPAVYGARLTDDTRDTVSLLFGGTSFVRTDSTCLPPYEQAVTLSGRDSNDTWSLSSSGAWTNLSANINAPAPRWDFNLGETVDGQIFLQGGANSTGVVFSDVWQWMGLRAGWRMLIGNNDPRVPPGGPLPRYQSGFTWDGWDRYFLMVGGRTASGSVVGDDYSFFPPLAWTRQSPVATFPNSPSTRYQEAMTFADQFSFAGQLGVVVLFGGESCGATSCTFLGDTWVFAGGVWSQVPTPTAPSARFGAAMAYNPWTTAILLFGGCGTSCPLGDSWQLTQSAKSRAFVWTQLFPSISPPARYFSTLTFDPRDQQFVLFGGCEGARGPCPADDTWVSFNNNWMLVPPAGGIAPSPRFGATATAFTRDPNARTSGMGGVFLFGGQGATGLLGDTWNFTSNHWSEIHSALNPPARAFATSVLDPVDQVIVLFGGCEVNACPVFDPWVYSLLPAPTTPPPGPGPPPPPPGPWPWAPVVNLPNPPPLTLYGAQGVWDPVDGPAGYCIYVGGRTATGATRAATDSIVGYTWTVMTRFV